MTDVLRGTLCSVFFRNQVNGSIPTQLGCLVNLNGLWVNGSPHIFRIWNTPHTTHTHTKARGIFFSLALVSILFLLRLCLGATPYNKREMETKWDLILQIKHKSECRLNETPKYWFPQSPTWNPIRSWASRNFSIIFDVTYGMNPR